MGCSLVRRGSTLAWIERLLSFDAPYIDWVCSGAAHSWFAPGKEEESVRQHGGMLRPAVPGHQDWGVL